MCGNKDQRIKTLYAVCCTALFIATVLLTVCITFYLTENYLQGDISSDLVYANHLYETRRLVSDEWYGSTEIRILRTEWIFAPLFALFKDWHLVRFVGTLIVQGIMVLSFGYMIRQVGADRNSFFLGSSVLLVPYCFSYGVNVLYGCFYATYVSMIFLSVALFVSLFNQRCMFRAGKIVTLCLLGFVGSLGGPRMLINMAAPAFLLILYMNMRVQQEIDVHVRRAMHQALGIGTAQVVCSVAGYLVNSIYLSKRYAFADVSIELGFGLFEQLDQIATSYLYSFGFQNRLPLTSLRGLIALVCAGVCLFYLGWNVKKCLYWQCGRDELDGVRKAYMGLFGFFALLVMIAFKALTTDNHSNDTYYLLISMWVVPWAALLLDRMNGRMMRAAAVAVLLALYLSGLINMLSFVFPERYRQYENDTFHHMQLPQQMKESCSFLEDEGFTFGYATFWHANVVTEMTDGKIRVAGTALLPGKEALMDRYYWLTSKELMQNARDRAFILLSLEEEEQIRQNEDMNAVRRIYGDEYFAVYELLDPQNVYNGVIR